MSEEIKQELKPFKDPYFKGLDNQIIANLAKKSIRLTTENRKLEQALDEVKKYFKSKDTSKTNLFNISVIEQEIGDIINKANTAPTTIFDKIQSFSFDDCYIAILPFSKRIETLEEIKAWFNEEFKEQ